LSDLNGRRRQPGYQLAGNLLTNDFPLVPDTHSWAVLWRLISTSGKVFSIGTHLDILMVGFLGSVTGVG
jgi:hypothetical protein